MIYNVTTQEQLNDALEKFIKDEDVIWLRGNGKFEITKDAQVTAYGSSQVRACDSSQVRACDSSQVTAYDSSQVTAYGSSQVTACGSSQVTAYDSSQVTAYGSSQVRACDSSQVTATPLVAITITKGNPKVTGGHQIRVPKFDTPELWCQFYGIEIKDGVAILYKGVGDDFKSPKGTYYTPGTIPVAEDWDDGKEECGGGLHFSPRPFMTIAFNAEAKKFVGCPVALKDIVMHPDGEYPEKVKARGCCGPVFECDIDGNPVEA